MAICMKYYVGVKTEDGMAFVTEVDYSTQKTYWNRDDRPLAMNSSRAEDVANGLLMNGYWAVVVCSFVELNEHFLCNR